MMDWCLQSGAHKGEPITTLDTAYLELVFAKNQKTITLLEDPTHWKEPIGVGQYKDLPVKDVSPSYRQWLLNSAIDTVEHVGEELQRRRTLKAEEEERKGFSPGPLPLFDSQDSARIDALECSLADAFTRIRAAENKVEEMDGRLKLAEKWVRAAQKCTP